MSKVVSYLQGHIFGEVSSRSDVREQTSQNGSILRIEPEMVVYPKTTNDIRKTARFAWQLAEKGHTLPITARGEGHDGTGASIGKGINIIFPRHMHKIFEYESKQKLVRLQPGVSTNALQQALGLHGTSIPALPDSGTVGGAIANDADSLLSDKYGTMADWISQLEVILPSGEVIQTERISKRELNKRKGIQGREGDIYRGIDAVLEDHADLIARLKENELYGRSGYYGIAHVKDKNGSFDLTPLIAGSQGSLAIISEMILRAEFVPRERAFAAVLFESAESARDALDTLRSQKPAYLEYFDGRYLRAAFEQGKKFSFIDGDAQKTQAMVLFGFDDFNERARRKHLKKAIKQLEKLQPSTVISSLDVDSDEVETLHEIVNFVSKPVSHADRAAPALVPGCFVPPERFEEFIADLSLLEASLHVDLPVYGSALRSIYTIRPTLSLQKVSDKQKSLKILEKISALIKKHNGNLIARDGEGRLLSRVAREDWDEEYKQMMGEIKNVFDPHNMLNPGVKSDIELRDLVANLRNDNSIL